MDNDRNDESGDAGLLILARAAPTVAWIWSWANRDRDTGPLAL